MDNSIAFISLPKKNKSNKILVEVKKEFDKDNKLTHLCFIYQDKDELTKSENTYPVIDDGDGPYILRDEEIHYLGHDGKPDMLSNGDPHIEIKTRKCFLINKDQKDQIESRIKKEEVDLKYCIFLSEVNSKLFSKSFDKKVNFDGAIFTKNADFKGVKFAEQTSFRSVTFTGQAYFQSVIFTKNADFYSAEFIGQVYFESTTFAETANFGCAEFVEEASFLDTKFTKQASFSDAKFTKQAYFQIVTFTEQAIFLNAEFSQNLIDFTQAQFLTALDLNGVESITLNLDQSQLNKIYYDTDCKFSAGNRETFLILKSIALKQHDKIKALEFNSQEYMQHYEKLSWSNWRDVLFYGKFILWFERWASYFGTSIVLPILWYFGFAGLFCWFMNGSFDIDTFINFIIPTNIAIENFLINNYNYPSSLDYVLFVIYKILQITLLYEIIKTFRQYSRNL